ncbi:MAG: hypothetical protein R2864_14655 [Syntrophotaleaceae bacterium]
MKLLIFSSYSDRHYIEEAMQAGASNYPQEHRYQRVSRCHPCLAR